MNIVKDLIETFSHSMTASVVQDESRGFIEHIDAGYPVIVSYYTAAIAFAGCDQPLSIGSDFTPYFRIVFNDSSIGFDPYIYGEDYRRLNADEIKSLRDLILIELI